MGAVKQKSQIDYLQSYSLRDLLVKVNKWNDEHPERAILKEDIIQIMKEEGTYILLYYRNGNL